MAADIPARRAELADLQSQMAALQDGGVEEGGDNQRPHQQKNALVTQLAQLASVRVAEVKEGSVTLELLGLSRPYTMDIRFGRSGIRSALLSASIHPEGVRIADLVEYCVSINDASFLVAQTLVRAQCHGLRAAEVAAISARHLCFDESASNRLRVTFPSGVIACIETGPDYPSGAGPSSVHLTSLDTMGIFADTLDQARALVGGCVTLTEMVDALATRFQKRSRATGGK